jgi:hypothetical protein
MTINDEFFKKNQENLRRIKAQNNDKTMKSYNIDGKAEAQKLEPAVQEQEDNNVIVVDFRRKSLTPPPPPTLSVEERYKRIGESIDRINALMKQLEQNK